jgi:signal recognition particle receptor subunit beta
MSSINLHTCEINIKVVYYGPGLGGKTTSIQYIHRALKPDMRGQLVSLATGIDRTLFFDFLPVKLPKVKDYTIRMSLYTVPGQVHYNATRKLVLQGADGVVFVADSQVARRDANMESISNLYDNLRGHGMNPEAVPLVLQYNKRDLGGVLSMEQLDEDLNKRRLQRFETCALSGHGIFDAMRTITKMVMTDLKHKGIYHGKAAAKAAAEAEREVVVSPRVEEGLVKTLERRVEAQAKPVLAEAPAPPPAIKQSRGLTFSELWSPGASRDQILAMEGDIERGDYPAVVKRAEGMLREYVGESIEDGRTNAEALLMLGVHGGHYARFRNATYKTNPVKADALFCIFFLADIELRIRAVGMKVEE